jgi:hypothetical protein
VWGEKQAGEGRADYCAGAYEQRPLSPPPDGRCGIGCSGSWVLLSENEYKIAPPLLGVLFSVIYKVFFNVFFGFYTHNISRIIIKHGNMIVASYILLSLRIVNIV